MLLLMLLLLLKFWVQTPGYLSPIGHSHPMLTFWGLLLLVTFIRVFEEMWRVDVLENVIFLMINATCWSESLKFLRE